MKILVDIDDKYLDVVDKIKSDYNQSLDDIISFMLENDLKSLSNDYNDNKVLKNIEKGLKPVLKRSFIFYHYDDTEKSFWFLPILWHKK